MSYPIWSLLTAAMFALPAASAGAAPPFVPPSEAMPPFRRDKLPIDTDSMVSLSREMALLSQSADMDEAPQRRAAAQALALALALDPANASARDNLSSIAEGKRLRSPDPEVLTRAKARIWQLTGWLGTPEAGEEGKLLADLIGDTAAAFDPGHPSAYALQDSGERGKWGGWVAPLSEFEERTPVRADKPLELPREKPKPPSAATESAQFALTEASVKTLLYAYDKTEDGYRFGNTVARMEARAEEPDEDDEEERPEGLRLEVPCREGYEGDTQDFVITPILRALEAADIPLPKNGRITLRAGDGDTYSFRRNTNAISGTGFVLAHAALTGSLPEATTIGVIDMKGRLVPPANLWYYVDSLREGDGGRLVIPADAEEHFLALLTFEEPDFFLKYEVFTASTPREFAELCAKTPGAKQTSATARFQEIRDKAPTNGLGPYLANRFVRQRLLDIHADMPQHLSAKMLALQGSPERPPRTLPKKILASVIWQAVAPVHSALEIDLLDINSDKIASMEKAHEDARAALDRLDRLAERADTELLTRAKAVTSDLRALTRTLSSRSADYDTRYSAITKSYDSAKNSNETFRRELSAITGDPLPEDALDLIRRARDRFRDE